MRSVSFVVGAGASSEFELPVGSILVEQIANALRAENDSFGHFRSLSDPKIYRAIERKYQPLRQMQQAIKAAASIRKNMGLAPSIDNFLDARKHDPVLVYIGKLAIARQLLLSERASTLAFDESNTYNRLEFSRMKENWLKCLFRILVEGRDYEAFLKALTQIRFLCFNYDRVIERFFFLATESYFEKEEGLVAEDLGRVLNVVHPYGVLGRLRSQVIGSGYGADLNEDDLVEVASGIRTFTEGVGASPSMSEIGDFVGSSEAICFLGFAFHPINVGLLKSNASAAQKIIGTSRGLSPVTCGIVRAELKRNMRTSVEPEFLSLSASELVSHFSAYFSGR